MIPVGVRFELFVDDVERSLAFYGATLGLQPPPGYDPQGYVPVSAGRVRPWGQTDFRLIDPDGYYLRVTSTG